MTLPSSVTPGRSKTNGCAFASGVAVFGRRNALDAAPLGQAICRGVFEVEVYSQFIP